MKSMKIIDVGKYQVVWQIKIRQQSTTYHAS